MLNGLLFVESSFWDLSKILWIWLIKCT